MFLMVVGTTVKRSGADHQATETQLSVPTVSFDSRTMQVEVMQSPQAYEMPPVSFTQLIGDLYTGMEQDVTRFFSRLESMPKTWEEITPYRPQEVLQLASYQIRYALNESPVLNTQDGVIQGPSGNETYYNLDMSWVVWRLEHEGYEGEYYIREDGVKMYGDYIMCAADFSVHPFGTIVQTSLGEAIVCDTGMFIYFDPYHLDIAAAW
ncbi:MAG: hypothetical protein IJQ12_04205 [Lachnospiraceae bacterium]|nr:hypothetical protein [Lachnospiraceae bacterium]